MTWLQMIPLTIVLSTLHGEDLVQPELTALSLEDVLTSTERHYPPLLAAIQQIEVARGDFVSAGGAFDTVVQLAGATDRFGFYENERFDVGLRQAVKWWGAQLYAGWRIGQGGFATYNGLKETRDGGEIRAGITLPLLRDRATDQERARVESGRLGISIAAGSVEVQRLAIRELATSAYWDWVAAGQALRVARNLLSLALARDAFVRESVAAGALAAIEVTDNRQAILSRRANTISAEQQFRNASIYVSLYYRDDGGAPIIVSEDRLPDGFPAPRAFDTSRADEDVALALERRPELRVLRAETDRVQIQQDLATNVGKPTLDLSLGATAEAGTNPDVKRGPSELKLRLVFELPVQRRVADGKWLEARAKLTRLQRNAQFLTDKIEVEVREAVLAMDASHQRAELLGEEVDVARELRELERERYDLGDSDLFTVNLREQAAASAETRWLKALLDYHKAVALYRLVTAAP